MRGILVDINIYGHARILQRLLESSEWEEVWNSLAIPMRTFAEVGLPRELKDSAVWSFCQRQELVLITANRNDDGPDSLEQAIRGGNGLDSLPVFTLADPDKLSRSREYAEKVVEHMLEYLLDIDRYRGTGRIYLP